MKSLASFGNPSPNISYSDRPTVKCLIKDGKERILILNNGLLPGGGIEHNENNLQALERELREELGMAVYNIRPIGKVIQYRDYLAKKYIIYGYLAELQIIKKDTHPQDEGEASFKLHWLNFKDTLDLVNDSIFKLEQLETKPQKDSYQGKVYNLMTTRAFLLDLD